MLRACSRTGLQQQVLRAENSVMGAMGQMQKILVTYASRFGSTQGIAEAIGAALADGGMSVDVLPMRSVRDLSGYGAVVAGSAINGGEWLPEAMDFVRQHRDELNRKPFAAFLVCMTLTMRNAAEYR